MTDYVLPSNWKFNGSKENQTTFVGPGHTVSAPYFAIFDRIVPQSNGRGGVSNPSYRLREIRGFVNEDGFPINGRAVVETTVRWPLGVDSAVIEAMIVSMGTRLSDPNMAQDIVEEQLLPRNVASE